MAVEVGGGGGVGGVGGVVLAPAVSRCLFAHECDAAGVCARVYFNLQMSRQVIAGAALVCFQG